MSRTEIIEIGFPDLSCSEAGNAAELLQTSINDELRNHGEQPVATRRRTNEYAADLGTIVQLVLTAHATTILMRGVARAISLYFGRTNRASLSISRQDGTQIIITNIESRDVAKIASQIGKLVS